MPTARELTDPYLEVFTRVPPASPGVCLVCHSVPNPGFATCWSCDQTMAQVSHPLRRIVPISLYKVGGQLHTWLRSYKNARSDMLTSRLRLRIAATVGRFLDQHGGCVAPGGWDGLASVPSTGTRVGPHPLARALRLIPRFGEQYEAVLEPGTVRLDHLRADDRGFRVTRDVAGQRILLVDDTLTSGARMQSAASALHVAGADVVAGVAVGRVFDPGWSERHAAVWEQARSRLFSFEECCLEAPPWPQAG